MNLSHRTLSEVEISLLSKGLKFSPTPTDLDKAQLKADLDVFKRRMRLRWFFRDSESNPLDIKISKFRCKSSWNPPTSDPLLESFLSQLEKEVLSITTDGKYYSNLSSSELSALNNFKQGRNCRGGLGGCFTPPILKNSISQGKAEGISSSRRAKEIRNQVSQNILIYFTFLSNPKHMLVFPICCGIVK